MTFFFLIINHFSLKQSNISSKVREQGKRGIKVKKLRKQMALNYKGSVRAG